MGSEMDISEYDVKESLEAAEYIAEKAQDVKIYKRGIEKLAFHVLNLLNFCLKIVKPLRHIPLVRSILNVK